MSRIIVKNLPKKITEKKLSELFSKYGFITDLQLKYTKDGVSRQFAFIGYKSEEEAKAARDGLNNTFMHTYKIQVEACKSLNDPDKPKPWKEYVQKKNSKELSVKEQDVNKEKSGKSKSKGDIPDELKDDVQFKEFLAVNTDRKSKPLWADDVGELEDSQSGSGTSADEKEENDEYSSQKDKLEKEVSSSPEKKTSICSDKQYDDSFTVKVRNLPYLCKKKQIKDFFHPLKISSLRLPPKVKGIAFVKFETEKDMKKALNKNKGFLGGRRVDVIKYVKKQSEKEIKGDFKQSPEEKEKNEELLAETGRLYIRNLCYSVTEAEVEQLFSKYGPLAEVNVPIDLLTKRAQGFAFVSYVFSEHAVKAFSELDGTIFQGRVLHIIPAQCKKEFNTVEDETNYKKKKEAKMKAISGSSHNWNILFMGMNAVADVIAEKYNVDKSKLLSGDSNESVAVRMALAETQIVLETRRFLTDNGVELDAFSQPAAERSKTVIVVKHLPAKTSSQEINELFSKHGTVSRVILPPTGMVALVEFQDPTEAKTAFKRLAYSRFRHLPLYLEWAPMNAVKDKPTDISENEEIKEKEETKESSADPKSDDEQPPPGTTVFVKNLNFSTIQETFKKHFEPCGPINYAAISMKKDIKTGKLLSMGFGFVQFKKKSSAIHAIQNLQLSKLDGHSLELKFATRSVMPAAVAQRKKSVVKKQNTAKILVRNIPFEASDKEIRDLFKEFGIIKFLRLPKKIGSEEHRGFGFVEYMTKSDAKRAFETLCHSTHLFGRRLVLEWANPESSDVGELRKKTAKDFLERGPKTKLQKKRLMEDVALASTQSQLEEEEEEES